MAKIDPSLTAPRPVAELTQAMTPVAARASAAEGAAAVADAFEKIPRHELARSALFGAGGAAMTSQGATAADLARMLGDVAAAGPHLPGGDRDPASFGRPAGAERAQERRRLPVEVPWSPAARALLDRGGEGFREWVGAETGRSHAAWREEGWSHYLWGSATAPSAT